MAPYDLRTADDPWASAVLLHPHPDMGGDRFNNVVGALFEALPPAGVTALRFDFSSSKTETAVAETIEMLDLLATAPRFLVGYSFGGGIAAAVTDSRIDGRVLVAPPPMTFPEHSFVIRAEHDQFFPTSELHADAVVGGADHFFVGRTDELATQTLELLTQAAR